MALHEPVTYAETPRGLQNDDCPKIRIDLWTCYEFAKLNE
jgi:NADPH-dependent 7-cyano-7-deazaguanine reductase QueF-like protein